MPIDPLSGTTRNAKRNLLVTATLAITYRAFDVSIEKIPIAGLVIDFNKGVFSFLLVLILLYFIVTFSLYYLIDIRNFEETLHQRTSASTHSNEKTLRIERFLSQGWNRASHRIKEPLSFRFNDAANLFLREYLDANRSDRRELFLNLVPEQMYTLKNDKRPWDPIADANEHLEAREYLNAYVIDLMPRIVSFERQSAAVESMRYTGVRFLYAFRNYGSDGLFPIGLGIVALLAIYHAIPLQWLQEIAPPR